ncbi:hypothetical protein RJ639_010206 [Escallonia herrerae]|uniref:HVA22-like protein n=1 Tax=Escallonia herrerae TaxID=1293975 RepID=A0AA89ATL6_9ASTE|nr:hypothetical protein RJ639_010206 [Escallonia herrerae]
MEDSVLSFLSEAVTTSEHHLQALSHQKPNFIATAGDDVALPFVSNVFCLSVSVFCLYQSYVLILIPIWYDVKLAFVAWLVLPQFRGAAFIYDKFVREKIMKKYGGIDRHSKSPNGKGKNKFVDFITPKKGEHEAY